jgi:ATP synthase F1 gamma subunit
MWYNKGQLLEQVELVETLNILAHAYEEISVMRMQKVRASVISTRAFLEKLAEVFHDVKSSYRREILALMQNKNRGKKNFVYSTIAKNGKTANVIFTSNARLYGDIVRKVFNEFIESVKKDPNAEIIIVGRLGKDYFDSQYDIKKNYQYFEIPDNNASINDLKPLVVQLMLYDKVNVFYGQFSNLMVQQAMASSLSGDQPIGSETAAEEKYTFFFEPSLEKVLNFFEHQVFGSLLKQTVHESELARLASRARAMESAIANIEKEEGILKVESRKFKKRIGDKKRMEGLSGIALWN